MQSKEMLGHRILFLSEQVSSESANVLIAGLLLLDADDHEAQIDLYLNSPGGSTSDGLAIIDVMNCITAPVSTICVGMAASMAALILAAGAPGRRLITPNAEAMIHQSSAGISGSTSDIRLFTDRMVRHQEHIERLLAGWTGRPVEQVREDMKVDHWMSAQESVEYGLVDAIIEPIRADGAADAQAPGEGEADVVGPA